jgi:hypothetical protein
MGIPETARKEKRGQMERYEGPLGFVAACGSMKKQADSISAYRRPDAALHGPYWLVYLGGANEFNGKRGVYKVMYDESPCTGHDKIGVCDGQSHGTFLRYADGDQVDEIYAALREDRIEEFIELAHMQSGIVLCGGKTYWSNGTVARNSLYGDWGDEYDAGRWIEDHDDTIVEHIGPDQYAVQKFGCERQIVTAAQLHYIAQKHLDMPPGFTYDRDVAPRLKAEALATAQAHKIAQGGRRNLLDAFDEAEKPARKLLDAFDEAE